MGLGAEMLEVLAGGGGEGTASPVSVDSAGGYVVAAFWSVLSIEGSMGKTESRFLSVKTKHAVIERQSARRTRLRLGSPGE
jgi:hypothetical protein